MILDDSIWTPVMRLLAQSPGEVTTRASLRELDELQRSVGFDPPRRLLQWLTRCNGLTCGPGGLFGTGTARPSLTIEHILRIFPTWQERRWIPVSGDGCGDHYVLDAGQRWPASARSTTSTCWTTRTPRPTEVPDVPAGERDQRIQPALRPRIRRSARRGNPRHRRPGTAPLELTAERASR